MQVLVTFRDHYALSGPTSLVMQVAHGRPALFFMHVCMHRQAPSGGRLYCDSALTQNLHHKQNWGEVQNHAGC
eukprot:2794125-Amphidinium_carterae.1